MVGTARRLLTEEEMNDRFIQEMVVETELVKTNVGVVFTGEKYYEYRSATTIPNGSKYLGVPNSPPPSLNTTEIFEILKIVYPEGNAQYKPNYRQDPVMGGNDQIIFDGYQFFTPRDAEMINKGLFTTLSFHNKMIGLFRVPR
tara:strand:- start:74 stop:502 length:429 start_codon:yes stop_codon:yes gene_type:complete